jgi:hypothetical protein
LPYRHLPSRLMRLPSEERMSWSRRPAALRTKPPLPLTRTTRVTSLGVPTTIGTGTPSAVATHRATKGGLGQTSPRSVCLLPQVRRAPRRRRAIQALRSMRMAMPTTYACTSLERPATIRPNMSISPMMAAPHGAHPFRSRRLPPKRTLMTRATSRSILFLASYCEFQMGE